MADKQTSASKPLSARSQPQIVTSVQSKPKALRKPKVHVLMDTDDLVMEQVGGFVNFLRENAVLGLAIGFVAGQQAQALVKALISGFIDPAFQVFFGESLSTRTAYFSFHTHHATFLWGAFVYALLNVIFVLAAIYATIKLLKLDRLNKPKEVVINPPATTKSSKQK